MLDGMNSKIKLLKVGHCTHPQAIVMRGGKWKKQIFPALVGLIDHPQQGYILFDTGYSPNFMRETKNFPECLYRYLTPVCLHKDENIVNQLQKLHIHPDKIKHVIISHFHADHISALSEFKQAVYWCSQRAWTDFNKKKRWTGLMKGYLPALLPSDFSERVKFIEETSSCTLPNALMPFTQGWDLFGDGLCRMIDLPGHAAGHMGLLYESKNQRPLFMIADACWSIEALIQKRRPRCLAYWLFDSKTAYDTTMLWLTQLYERNTVLIMPSHCAISYERWENENS